MRLIHATTLELREFMPPKVPPYTILSHTWGDEEVSFQEMASPGRVDKKGFHKIMQACRLALEEGLAFAWVDTCCIDKSSSAELSESINSMFRWYAEAAVCHAWLDGLSENTETRTGLPHCRWFTRGWTLQELLAPKVVKFYDEAWIYRGTKDTFASIISGITRVPIDTLRGDKALSESSVAARLSWAARRETTRAEDEAYCLLGIFQLNMALLYGEGNTAFQRLQHRIMARYSDLTILAWDFLPGYSEGLVGILAPSPAAFENSSGMIPFNDDLAEFSVTNKGLLLTGGIPLRVALTEWRGLEATLYLLMLGLDHGQDRGIYLRKIGPKLFCRVGRILMAGIGRHNCRQTAIYSVSETRLLMDPTPVHTRAWQLFRQNALLVPANSKFKLQQAIPRTLWDHADSVFLRPEQYRWVRYSMVLAMIFEGNLSVTPTKLVVLCDYRREPPEFKIFAWDEYPREAALIFQEKYREDTMSWEDLDIIAPAVLATSNSLNILTQSGLQYVSVSYGRKCIWSEEAPVVSLQIGLQP